MNTTDKIFNRYYEALIADWDDEHAFVGAVRLALRLAIADTAALAQPAPQPVGHVSNVTDQRVVENVFAQIARFNEWLEINAPALCHNSDLDTAEAVLMELGVRDRRMIEQSASIANLRISLNDASEDAASARQELTALLAERDSLRQQLAQLDADNAGLIAEVDRLTRLNSIAVSAVNQQITNGTGAATWWANLDDETNDWRISLDAGRRTFRQLSRRTRLLLGRAVALHIGNGQMPKQADFDAGRPAWMPTATSLCGTFGCTWYELPDLDPATVAP